MGITLHPEKGVNPFMTVCPRCGSDGSELVLVGTRDRVITCDNCGGQNYGGLTNGKCGLCNERTSTKNSRKLEEGERIPGSLCASCEKEINEHSEIVESGGVYFRCKECGKTGVIKESEFAKHVREAHGKEFSQPVEGRYKKCGVEFDTCEEHHGGQ